MKRYNKKNYTPFTAGNGERFCQINYGSIVRIYPIDSEEFMMEFKRIYRKQKGEMISQNIMDNILEEMRLDAYENRISYNLESRIFNEENGDIVYLLNPDENLSVWIHDGAAELIETPEMMFRYDSSLRNQVVPNLKVKPEKLPVILKRHFHLTNEDDLLILALYLVAAFSGNKIAHPILIFSGSKGSGKSRAARMLSSIVDPQNMDLYSIPKTRDDLAIRLHNSYMTVLDNISFLRKELSDILAMSITGVGYAKRALYHNTKEVKLDIRCLLVLTGIEVASKESDVLDRSILLPLERLNMDEIIPESQLKENFEKDLPKIIGACFRLLAVAENDTTPINLPRTRMADAFDLMIKVGRALGYEDDYISSVLWSNQSIINCHVVTDDVVGQCVVAFMEEYTDFQGSVTDFLYQLQIIAKKNHIDKVMPKKPNVLSRRLNALKSNLEVEYGIHYTIKNNGSFRKIEIWTDDLY